MTFDEAKAILGRTIDEADGGLTNLGHYTAWTPGDTVVTLDDNFSLEELEAIVVYCKELNKCSNG